MEVRRDPARIHVLALLVTSIAYETYFLVHWVNPLDEGWLLYAAQRLHAGGRLYEDVFFVFPPGHVLAAWLGVALAPPGVLVARLVYASFAVSLVLAIYGLGRRMMPPRFAFFAAILVALAAPFAHMLHVVFGYRYLIWSVLALLAFSARLERDDPRWLGVAGLAVGVGVAFRLDAAAAAFGIVAAIVASRPPRAWAREGIWFAAGLLAVLAPVVAWFSLQVGLDTLWREAVVRPMVMTRLQSLEMPPLRPPEAWTWKGLSDVWVASMFRLPWLLYGGYAVALAGRWLRARRSKQAFEDAFLLAVVVWAAVFFSRSLGRADIPHLDSALPPLCLLTAHLVSITSGRLRSALSRAGRRTMEAAVCTVLLLLWVVMPWAQIFPHLPKREILPGEFAMVARVGFTWADVIPTVLRLRNLTRPGDTVLDLSASPFLHVLSGRPGPGGADIVMPGSLLDAEEERALLARIEANPPAAVVVAAEAFDKREDRTPAQVAPQIMEWVEQRYEPLRLRRRASSDERRILVPRAAPLARGE